MSVRRLYDRVFRVEDLVPGTSLRTASRTILESDIHQFCQLMGDMAGIHMSRLAAAEGRSGSVIAPGPMMLSVAIALTTSTGWFGPSSTFSWESTTGERKSRRSRMTPCGHR